MSEWRDKFKLGKSAFVKRNLRLLPLTELESILTKTRIVKTRKLRPRLEAMTVESHPIELDIHEWSRMLLDLCGGRMIETTSRGHLLGIAKRIANQLAEAIGIDPPGFQS